MILSRTQAKRRYLLSVLFLVGSFAELAGATVYDPCPTEACGFFPLTPASCELIAPEEPLLIVANCGHVLPEEAFPSLYTDDGVQLMGKWLRRSPGEHLQYTVYEFVGAPLAPESSYELRTPGQPRCYADSPIEAPELSCERVDEHSCCDEWAGLSRPAELRVEALAEAEGRALVESSGDAAAGGAAGSASDEVESLWGRRLLQFRTGKAGVGSSVQFTPRFSCEAQGSGYRIRLRADEWTRHVDSAEVRVLSGSAKVYQLPGCDAEDVWHWQVVPDLQLQAGVHPISVVARSRDRFQEREELLSLSIPEDCVVAEASVSCVDEDFYAACSLLEEELPDRPGDGLDSCRSQEEWAEEELVLELVDQEQEPSEATLQNHDELDHGWGCQIAGKARSGKRDQSVFLWGLGALFLLIRRYRRARSASTLH